MPPVFGGKQPGALKAVVRLVESVIEELGIPPAEAHIPSKEGPLWGLMKGSAEVYVSLTEGEDQPYFHVFSPVMPLLEENLAPLCRRLLELNCDELTGAAFGMRGDRVVVCADRPVSDLDRSEVKEMIVRVGTYSDHYDDMLVAEFGGRKHSEA